MHRADMSTAISEVGLVGLAVMGQNLALNVAQKVCHHINLSRIVSRPATLKA